jgi:hypothetical protein
MVGHIKRYVTGATVLAYGAVYLLGRCAGSTEQERRATLPGDDLVGAPNMVTNHALNIDAASEAVWPWLTQMGWHLGGYYTPHWVDRLLFPQNRSSLDRLDPAPIRHLAVGDTIPDGPARYRLAYRRRRRRAAHPRAAFHQPSAGDLPGPARDCRRLDLDVPADRPAGPAHPAAAAGAWAHNAVVAHRGLSRRSGSRRSRHGDGMLRGIRRRAESAEPWEVSAPPPLPPRDRDGVVPG